MRAARSQRQTVTLCCCCRSPNRTGPFCACLFLCQGHANHFRRWESEHERGLDLRQAELLAAAASRPANTIASLQLSLAAQPLTGPANFTFNQFVDHFEVTTLKDSERRKFAQRYYSNFDYYKPGGPAFLYVGGEAELRSSSIGRGEIVTLAQRHNGALFGLEHRYYGQSHPFETLASENMVYLTVEQALEDAATFIAAMTHQHALGDGLWFTVGGSYPAVLSSFMRTKYPHLVAGALASSGPVRADAEFWQYEAVNHSNFFSVAATVARVAQSERCGGNPRALIVCPAACVCLCVCVCR